MARMELPVLDKFCFIFPLKAGCITMAVINTIITFVLFVILITFAVDIKDADESKGDDAAYTVAVLLVLLLLVKFLLDLLFVYALHKEKSGIIKKYWIVFVVLFIISFLNTVFHMNAGNFIAQLFYLAENFYFIVVIRSYLHSISEDGVL